jgi:hypothetical protein
MMVATAQLHPLYGLQRSAPIAPHRKRPPLQRRSTLGCETSYRLGTERMLREAAACSYQSADANNHLRRKPAFFPLAYFARCIAVKFSQARKRAACCPLAVRESPMPLRYSQHEHDDQIASVSLTAEQLMSPDRFVPWIEFVVQRFGSDILRMKGIVAMKEDDQRFVIQGVHMLVEGADQRPWKAAEKRESRLVSSAATCRGFCFRRASKPVAPDVTTDDRDWTAKQQIYCRLPECFGWVDRVLDNRSLRRRVIRMRAKWSRRTDRAKIGIMKAVFGMEAQWRRQANDRRRIRARHLDDRCLLGARRASIGVPMSACQ